jgi:ribosomal protein S18 acetylase RimI-like enzyme
VRQCRIAVAQGGLRATLFWAAFGWLRANRLVGLRFTFDREPVRPVRRDGMTFRLLDVETLRRWRQTRTGLPTEFYVDLVDGVRTCAAALGPGGEIGGLIWVYRSGEPSRLFRLGPHEVELNHGYILPAHRRARLFRDLLAFACGELRAEGVRRVYAMVHAENRRSLRAFDAAGFETIGSVVHVFVFRPRLRVPRDRWEGQALGARAS